jgi:predicted nucleotidyltransferase
MNSKNKYIDLLHQFKIHYGKEYGITKIGIFGSVARGVDGNDSDIDIFYESSPIRLLDKRDLKNHLENYLKRPIDLVRNHKYINPLLLKHINNEIIYV